jgi:hypothetical protein
MSQPTPDHSSVLGHAIDRDEQRLEELLQSFRTAWFAHRQGEAVARFHRFRDALRRHLDWEEHDLIDPCRQSCTLLYVLKIIERDRWTHAVARELLAELGRIVDEGETKDRAAAHAAEALTDELERLLFRHRTLDECHLCCAMEEVLTVDALQRATDAIREPATVEAEAVSGK